MPSGLHHVREGAGPPLVLIAGIGSSGAAWRPVVPRLAEEREVWRVDLPGFGRSEALPAGDPCGVEALADAAERFFAEVGLERPHVAGNSLGGAAGLELGRRGVVASVTALSPAGFAGRAGQQYAGRSLQLTHWAGRTLRPAAPKLFRRPRLRRILCGQMFAHPERITPGEMYADLVTMLDGKGFHDVLTELDGHRFEGEIAVPVTIAWGTRDALLLPTQARRARRLLPDARHVSLHGCGHVPMSDDPEQVARVLLEGSLTAVGSVGGRERQRVDRRRAAAAQLAGEHRERPAAEADVVDEQARAGRQLAGRRELAAHVGDLLGGVRHLALRRTVAGALQRRGVRQP